MSYNTIPIYCALICHDNTSRIKLIDVLQTLKLPSDTVRCLKSDVINHLTLTHEFAELQHRSILLLRFFLLRDAVVCKAKERVGRYFDQVVDLQTLRALGDDCDIESSFESLGVHEEGNGETRSLRLVAFVELSPQAVDPKESRCGELIVPSEYDCQERERVIEKVKQRGSPSNEAEYSNYRHLQHYDNLDAAFNYQPMDLAPSPISIYEPAMIRFVINSEEKPLGPFTGKDRSAYEFMKICWKEYDNEGDRQLDLAALGVFKGRTVWYNAGVELDDPASSSGIPETLSDQIHRFPNIIFMRGDPSVLGGLIYQKLISSDDYRDLRRESCCPTFLIGYHQDCIIFNSAVFADRFFYQHVGLVYVHQLLDIIRKEEACHKLANAFRALSTAVAEIEAHYDELLFPSVVAPESPLLDNNADEAKTRSPTGPPPGQFPRWKSFESTFSGAKKRYTIKYIRRLSSRFDEAIFQGTMRDEEYEGKIFQIVVRFTYRYGKEGHALLAKARLAPVLYFAQELDYQGDNPNLWVVVMEYINGEIVAFDEASDVQKKKLKDAVATLHDHGFVSGSVLEKSVILRGRDDLYFINFDWCGKENEARYPMSLAGGRNTPWPEKAGSGSLIVKEHDLKMLGNMLNMGP